MRAVQGFRIVKRRGPPAFARVILLSRASSMTSSRLEHSCDDGKQAGDYEDHSDHLVLFEACIVARRSHTGANAKSNLWECAQEHPDPEAAPKDPEYA